MIVNTPDGTTVRETERVVADPTVVHTTEVRESNAAWWIGALVAIVAILAVVFLVTRSPTQDNSVDIGAAMEAGRAQGALEATQQGLSDAQAAAARAADQAAQATAEAREATARAAASAADATANAAETVTETVTPPPVVAPAE